MARKTIAKLEQILDETIATYSAEAKDLKNKNRIMKGQLTKTKTKVDTLEMILKDLDSTESYAVKQLTYSKEEAHERIKNLKHELNVAKISINESKDRIRRRDETIALKDTEIAMIEKANCEIMEAIELSKINFKINVLKYQGNFEFIRTAIRYAQAFDNVTGSNHILSSLVREIVDFEFDIKRLVEENGDQKLFPQVNL